MLSLLNRKHIASARAKALYSDLCCWAECRVGQGRATPRQSSATRACPIVHLKSYFAVVKRMNTLPLRIGRLVSSDTAKVCANRMSLRV